MNSIRILLDDVYRIKGVLGVLVVSSAKKVLFQDLAKIGVESLEEAELETPFLLFDSIKEVDLLFDQYRIYIRKCPLGFLWVVMQPDASAAMIRLQCDIIIPRMKPKKQNKKGLGRLFK